jgi:hypothetical protein
MLAGLDPKTRRDLGLENLSDPNLFMTPLQRVIVGVVEIYFLFYVWTWGQCYDHTFLRFLPIFCEKNWRFSQKPIL